MHCSDDELDASLSNRPLAVLTTQHVFHATATAQDHLWRGRRLPPQLHQVSARCRHFPQACNGGGLGHSRSVWLLAQQPAHAAAQGPPWHQQVASLNVQRHRRHGGLQQGQRAVRVLHETRHAAAYTLAMAVLPYSYNPNAVLKSLVAWLANKEERTADRGKVSGDTGAQTCVSSHHFFIRVIAGTGSQPCQVLDPFLNNQGAHGHSWGRFGFR